MANPAPTINQINAFNATQGTTIDFNIIGGTELVRSNKIYIYDLSDNSLICTHLYVSTESIHELPANTDSSIVYESGKSSADFVNGAQYYAQIQTYTDTAGTQGGSGLSVAKMFWCLVDPTLTITTIPSTISTTSYNVSATYTDTSASVVSNIIQQYQFNLYSAVGSLLQSSGVVVGSGTQQGTSDVYDISYNFTGLNVGSSYYVTVGVTTTQGMNVIAQSGTFTVSIETPTLGEATVVNNACDGYISVTSNLSGEYGGSASGEIASFVTNSVNNISPLKVTLDPIQDLHGYDAPWVGGAGKNKLPNTASTSTIQGVTFTVNSDGTINANGTSTGWTGLTVGTCTLEAGTWYMNSHIATDYAKCYLEATGGGRSYATNTNPSKQIVLTETTTLTVKLYVPSGQTVNNVVCSPLIRKDGTTADYEPYENICPISGHDDVTVTVADDVDNPTVSEDYITTLPSTTYGGTLDLVSGELTVTHAIVDLGSCSWGYSSADVRFYNNTLDYKRPSSGTEKANAVCSAYNVDTLVALTDGTICLYANGYVYIKDTRYTDPTAFKQALSGVMLCYELATPHTYQLTPQQIQTLVGQNNVWSNVGEVTVTYNIPITNLLVKRQDVADVSGAWLTLYSQPITQASDMDFTFIDFTNQYGKTYKYALVPLLTQTQSGVEVEVEGGYTVSDEVQSVFDGVFIVDSTGSQKCKANVGYGNVDMNQVVGSITPIGAKYPIVITNSQNQYHNGSISGTIVPDDYYFNGNLSRIDMVNKRSELEQFLTNKRAKIIKDWNGNIWLVMIMDNVSCTFNNSYGMGIVNFSTNWVEVGDPTNQQDLQATGLINVGGV